MFVSQYYSVVVSWLCFSLVIIINHFKVLQWLPSYKLDLHNGTKPSLKLYGFCTLKMYTYDFTWYTYYFSKYYLTDKYKLYKIFHKLKGIWNFRVDLIKSLALLSSFSEQAIASWMRFLLSFFFSRDDLIEANIGIISFHFPK